MDKQTRNLLFHTTQAIRHLLEEEFARQLEGNFDIHPDGRVAALPGPQLTPAERLVRRRIADAISHRRAVGESDVESVRGYLAEAVFTFLNRLAALKMTEARGLVLRCVSQGDQSQGFKEFSGLAPGLIELPDRGYRLYLECLFDEIGREVGVLFDRTDSASQLWPRRNALEAVLEKLNVPALAGIWAEDETIGWIYQYYNGPEERAIMRDPKRGGSAAPRNSRELAVRNQFFTPRYVVEFLADNTLGRLWYEMTGGRTALREQCRYLIRRPNEVFLARADSDEVSAAQQWLQTGVGSRPDLWPLAHTVNGYQRAGEAGVASNQWVEERLPRLVPDSIASFSTQELLDLLFLFCRKERFCEGTIESLQEQIDLILGTVEERVTKRRAADLSPAEQLEQPVFIPHRPLKDPREIRLLDPACGSMHFGLYAFDLLEAIYEEAWQRSTELRNSLPQYAIDATTIRIKSWENLKCDSSGRALTPENAILAIWPHDDPERDRPGRLFFYHRDVAEERQDQLSLIIPLDQVNWTEFLHAGWVTEGTLAQRLDESFFYSRLSPEEGLRRFRREIPRLIIEHNIHGIDIDPRCAQIAGLALWLRAQKAWQRLGLKSAERPNIRRSNIVCAEPMPGEQDLLSEFVNREFLPDERGAYLELLTRVFDKMKLAGEAGSLLKIEDEIRLIVAEAKSQWKQRPRLVQTKLFDELEPPRQGELAMDLSGITDEQFWATAEQGIYKALRRYAEQAENGGGFQRRLFAEDASRGFAFIDLCRKRYDVAVMNPPFGEGSLPSKEYLDETYGDTKGDVYKAFVECFHARLIPAGFLGIISSRTGFFLGQSEDWRTRVVLRLFRPIALADLGSGVLDAMVEVAAYVLRSLSESEARDLTLSIVPVLKRVQLDKQDRFSLPKWQVARGDLKRHQAIAELEHLERHRFIQRSAGEVVRYSPLWHSVNKVTASLEPVYPPLVCIRALDEGDKGGVLTEAVNGSRPISTFVCNPGSFSALPSYTFAYWASSRVLDRFRQFGNITSHSGQTKCGLGTLDDFRFLRLWWECPMAAKWKPFAKGGAFSRWYSGVPLTLSWDSGGAELKTFVEAKVGSASRKIQAQEFYFRPGLTWPRRTQSGLGMRVLPAGCIFADKGPAAFVDNNDAAELMTLLGLMTSDTFCRFVELQMAFGSYEVGVIQRTPIPGLSKSEREAFARLARSAWALKRRLDEGTSTAHSFSSPALLTGPHGTLSECAATSTAQVRSSQVSIEAIQGEIDDLAFRVYGLDATDRAALSVTIQTVAAAEFGLEAKAGEDEDEEAASADTPALTADLLAYAVGCAFGRWDIRYATGERPAPPAPDPFDPLPVCPPGMLQNAAGLPATPVDVPSEYPLSISWPGILVDDPHHPEDVSQRVREVFALVWPDSADAIEQEACALLGAKALREWFRKPANFFADHLGRYSKSKRKAPIYWPLSSPHGLYTVWLYYHRLTADTLFTVLRDYVKPKLEYEERRAFQLRQEAGPTPSPAQRAEIAEADELVEDLRAFREELHRVTPLFRPDLNDGVILNHAPLWRMAGLPKWRNECQAKWAELVKGEYDWAHLALHLWPERVIPKCATDRSLAIAHGLEAVFWEEYEDKPGKPLKWRAKKVPDSELQALIASRTSPAVKAALETLGAAAGEANTPRRGRRKA